MAARNLGRHGQTSNQALPVSHSANQQESRRLDTVNGIAGMMILVPFQRQLFKKFIMPVEIIAADVESDDALDLSSWFPDRPGYHVDKGIKAQPAYDEPEIPRMNMLQDIENFSQYVRLEGPVNLPQRQ